MVKYQPAVQETWVAFLAQEYPLEKGMATHSSILSWRSPLTEETSGLQSMGLQRVCMTEQLTHSYLILAFLGAGGSIITNFEQLVKGCWKPEAEEWLKMSQ